MALEYYMTILTKTVREVKDLLSKDKRSIGFVPTMGALHTGHISLIRACRDECTTTVVSIFVNPLQFGPNEDYDRYPRNLTTDLKICEDNAVDIVFAPEVAEIYPQGISNENLIQLPANLTDILCGKSRPNHFQGVATVVKKLFNIINPDYVYFGEKDLQQLYIIRWLVKEFGIQTIVRACSIIRESNGLACSSRISSLSKEEKELASNIYKSLVLAKQNIKSGFFTVNKAILESMIFLSQFSGIKIEYFDVRDKDTLAKTDDYKLSGFYFLTAAKIGSVRLIDNIEI